MTAIPIALSFDSSALPSVGGGMPSFAPTGGDDTAALQAAINGARSLQILAGDSLISDTLHVSQGTEIIWRNGARLLAAHPTKDVLSIEASWSKLIAPHIEANVARAGGSYVTIRETATRVSISDGWYMSGAYRAIENFGTIVDIRDGEIRDTVAGGESIVIRQGFDLALRSIIMDAPAAAQPASGLKIISTGDVILDDLNIMHQGTDLLICPGAGNVASSIYAVNCFFDSADNGLKVVPVAGGSVQFCRFMGCWFSGQAQQGVFIQQGSGQIDGLEFVSPFIALNGNVGLLVNDSGPQNVKVSGGSISANGSHGVAIAAGLKEFSVTDCRIGPANLQGGNAGWGIIVVPGASDDYVISGNRLKGNTSGALSDGGTGAAKVVKDNVT